MRLLSFLTDIEYHIAQQSAAMDGAAWEVTRMVNYHRSLARMTLSTSAIKAAPAPGGTVVLQSFVLADGSPCLKASLAWLGSEAQSVISVYAKPQVDWAAEAERIASAWLTGPPAAVPTL